MAGQLETHEPPWWLRFWYAIRDGFWILMALSGLIWALMAISESVPGGTIGAILFAIWGLLVFAGWCII